MLFQNWWQRLKSRRLLSRSLEHEGIRRSFLLYVPQHRVGRGPLPVVVALHGGAGTPSVMARMSGLHILAEKKGFIVVYPAGTALRSRLMPSIGLGWNAAGGYSRQARREVDDVGFVRKVLTQLASEYEIDRDRIYAAGISLGGMMAYRLACEMSDTMAAIAVVAGTMTTRNCHPQSPVSVLHIHGSADQRVPLTGGRGLRTNRLNSWPPVRDGIVFWTRTNRCAAEPEVGMEAARVRRWLYRGEADVELCVVENGRHVWPGGKRGILGWLFGAQAGGFSATDKIWRFFDAHPRRRGPQARQPGA